MLKQLQQVGITYFTRPTPLGWLLAAGWAVLVAVLIANSDAVDPSAGEKVPLLPGILPLLFLVSAVLLIAATIQLEWQFASPQARLTPGYKAPHLTAWGVIFAILLIFIPAAQAWRISVSPWLSIAVCGTVATAFSYPRVAFFAVFIPYLLLADSEFDVSEVRPWWNADGYRLLVLIAITIVSWFAIIWRSTRTLRLNEDDAAFELPIWPQTTDASARPFRTAIAEAAERRWQAAPRRSDHSLDRAIAKSAGQSLWRRLNVVYRGERQSLLDVMKSLVSGGVIITLFLWSRGDDFRLDSDLWSVGVKMLTFSSLFASLAPAITLISRIPQMSSERLLPMANQAYADALVLNSAWIGAKAWLVLHVLAIAAIYGLPWEGLEQPSLATVASYVVISAAGMAATFGTSLCCAIHRGLFPAAVAVIVGLASIPGLLSYWNELRPHERPGAVPFWIVVLSISGAFLITHARFLWREKELP